MKRVLVAQIFLENTISYHEFTGLKWVNKEVVFENLALTFAAETTSILDTRVEPPIFTVRITVMSVGFTVSWIVIYPLHE